MINKDIYEMIKILMKMPKEKYAECKEEFLNTEFSPKTKDFLMRMFASIEKHRPELAEGGAV